jgi:hypothetical protein
LVNGRLQSLKQYVAGVRPGCGDCVGEDQLAFEPSTGRALLASRGDTNALRVVGPHGQLAHLTCPEDFTCRSEPGWASGTALGPGRDEITIEHTDQHRVQVIGFDGALRRTIDLSAALHGNERVDRLAWSPDRTRLAVQTSLSTKAGLLRRIWLVDREGGEPRLVRTVRFEGQPPKGNRALTYVWGLIWSPDSSRLGFVEEQAYIGTLEISVSMRALSLGLPEPGGDGPAVAKTVYDFASSRPTDSLPWLAWSPDGNRIAVSVANAVLELSAEDSSVLAHHPGITGVLIWPARQP